MVVFFLVVSLHFAKGRGFQEDCESQLLGQQQEAQNRLQDRWERYTDRERVSRFLGVLHPNAAAA